ncbi:hypothetical protein ACFWPH_04945 [Nocardia sp. NPDC058499]|uniref:hypothetical protein n=1 Tax=Nocardia sp. NPDC058499 TaxID=3346530 RepID=UPI0036497EBE
MTLVWTLGVPVAAVAFMAGALSLGSFIARAIGSPVATALFLPVSAMLGIGAWMLVLAAIWRLRRQYLRRTGDAMSAVVVDSELQRKHNRGPFDFDLWLVRVEVRFPHPETGVESRIQKQFFYLQFHEAKARALADELHAGASVPIIVHRNYALFDIPKRPVWADIW